MTIKKILLFGASGMLGRYILSYFFNRLDIAIIPIKYRITPETLDHLEQVLLENNIDDETCVINCIGQIPQRKTLGSDYVYFLVNSIFPHSLWSICKRYGAKMIQPATDCVFTGLKTGGMYLETDTHDEPNSYGLSKSLGEPLGCTVIRTSIIGRELLNRKSFLEWILTSNEQNVQKIQGWNNHYWNGITCLEYCKVLNHIIETNNFWEGVRHICSPTPVTKYEMAKMIVRIFELNIDVEKVESSKIVHKTLSSQYAMPIPIQELYDQIKDLKRFELVK
jgi:dTDP-4-dehydrorhamnose reductase